MRSLSAYDLLRIWEAGEEQRLPERALILLDAACPELTRNELATLNIGERDTLLLNLRELTSGPNLSGFVKCPRCTGDLEFEVQVGDLRAPPTRDAMEEETWEFVTEDLFLRFRLPNSWDLGAAAACEDPLSARSLLVQRCVLQASRGGSPIGWSDLSSEAVSGLARQMAELDPQAEVLLALQCPACDHRWKAVFDIVTFFWTELVAQAKRLLLEVHTLARAYGWREADILAMSARRRDFYLEMAS